MPSTPRRSAARWTRLWREVFSAPGRARPPDVDEDLYGGFWATKTGARCSACASCRRQLAAKRPAFHDGRLEELLFRYRARNFPRR